MQFGRLHPPMIALVAGLVMLVINFPIPKPQEGGIPISEYSSLGFILSCVALGAALIWFLFVAFGSSSPGSKSSKSSASSKANKKRKNRRSKR